MTRAEATRMRRLELENAELRARLDRHFDIYREQAWELVELRSQLQLLREIAAWTADTTGDTTTA